jgi:Tol biopolymer transport system component
MSASLRVLATACVLAVLGYVPPAAGQTHATRRGSLAAGDVQALGFSNSPSVSESGRFVVFPSNAGNLVPPDSNGEFEIYVRDLVLGTVSRVSVGLNNELPDQASRTGNAPAISDDGRYVVFESDATNLVADTLITSPNIYRYDRSTGVTELVSRSNDDQPLAILSTRPAISGNGRFVSFEAGGDVFVRDMVLGTTTDVSVNTAGSYIGGTDSALSTDGTRIVFASPTTGGVFVRNVTAGTTSPAVSVLPSGLACQSVGEFLPSISGTGRYVTFNCAAQAFVRDRDADADGIFDEAGTASVTRRIDESAAGVPADISDNPTFPRISKTGRFIVFTADATNLLGPGGDTNGLPDVYVADVDGDGDGVFYEAGDRRIWRASVASDGTPQSDASGASLRVADISDDGRIAAFNSPATNLVAADTNDLTDVFVYDHYAWRVADLFPQTTETMTPRISGNGLWTAFASEATTLVTGDTNGFSDVFVRDRRKALGAAGSVVRISVSTGGAQAIGGLSDQPSISHDGRFIVFRSFATNLVTGDSNGVADIFLHDRDVDRDGIFDEAGARTTYRVSVATGGVQATGGASETPHISPDGRFVAFTSLAGNIAGPASSVRQVYLYLRLARVTERISQIGGTAASADAVTPAVANNGVVAFATAADLSQDTNGASDVYVSVPDGGTRTIRLASRVQVSTGQNWAAGGSTSPALSPDGLILAYRSTSALIADGDNNGVADIFVASARFPGASLRVTETRNHQPANGASEAPAVSGRVGADIWVVSYTSGASNLAFGDTNGVDDVFATDVHGQGTEGTQATFSLDPLTATSRISLSPAGQQLTTGSGASSISADGNRIEFERPLVVSGGSSPSNGAVHELLDGKSATGERSPTPIVRSLDPQRGPQAGGTVILITGEGLESPEIVPFLGSAAMQVSDRGPDFIRAVTPPGTGTQPLSLEAASIGPGKSASSLSFTYEAGVSCSVTGSLQTSQIGAAGGGVTLSVSDAQSCGWSVDVEEDWLQRTPSHGQGSASVTVTVGANSEPGRRTGRVRVAGSVLTIEQDGIACSPAQFSETGVTVGAAGATGSVQLTTLTGCAWQLQTSGAVQVTTATAGDASEPVGYSMPANPGTSTRTATITIAGGATFTVTQQGLPSFSLAVNRTEGGGVTSSPAAIDCGSSCNASFPSGTVVTLTATALPGFQFVRWLGDCTGSTCVLTMTGNRAVTAEFQTAPPGTFQLAVAVSGNGSVSSSPPGIACPGDCTQVFSSGTTVTLTPTPAAGHSFSGWSGPGCGSTVQMTQDRSCTATFVQDQPTNRTLTIVISGSGTVTSIPGGISCGTDCTEPFAAGSTVALTTSAATGWSFGAWSGAGCGASVQMTQDRTCTATFVQNPPRTLTVTVTGSGTVTSVPAGINCGTDCTESLPSGTVVTLIATPAAGHTLQAWSGACSGTGSCVVQLTQAVSVTAAFVPATGTPITITGISPSSGVAAGGAKVRIRGTGFDQPGAVSVTLAGVPAPAVTVVDDTLIVVSAPAIPAAPAVVHEAVATPVATGSVVVSVAGAAASLPSAWRAVVLSGPAGTDTDGDGLPDQYEAQYSLDVLAADGTADADGDGQTNLQEMQAGTHPQGYHTRYLAEGATGTFFDTRLAIANVSTVPATTLVRFQTDSASSPIVPLTIPGESRRLLFARTVPTLASANFGAVVEADVELVVDRQMFWDNSIYGSHAETSVEAPGTTWYLAEGATHGRFDLFYLLQNPGTTDASVRIRFLRPTGPPLERMYTVAARQRMNVYVDLIPELAATDVSAVIESVNAVPIIVERAMYVTSETGRAFEGGHNSAAVSAPSTSWFLAEGATGTFFDTFVLLANPSPTDAEVTARYLLTGGTVVTKTYTVPANSRRTVWVDGEDTALANASVSTVVTSTNNVPIIVERSMWWPGPESVAQDPGRFPIFWGEAHNSFGSTVTGTKWAVADGTTGPAPVYTLTYYLIANTSPFPGSVRVTLLSEAGLPPVSRVFAVPANSRLTVGAADAFPDVNDLSPFGGYGAVIESLPASASPAAEIVVERAMYSNSVGGVFWAAGTNVLATRLR